MQPIVAVGINTYPDGGQVHVLPYLLGLRDPVPGHPADSTLDGRYNAGYGQGAYDAAWRALLAGAAVGVVLTLLLRR